MSEDSQLDEIERLAQNYKDAYIAMIHAERGTPEYKQAYDDCDNAMKRFGVPISWLQSGGLYYEMRRELDNTSKLCRNLHRLDNERAKECMKLRRENEQLKTEIANALGQIRDWER